MSLPDGTEYWWGVKEHRSAKFVYTHKRGLNCGHFHVQDTKKNKNVTCHACIKILGGEAKKPDCNVCLDKTITDAEFEANDTYTYTCSGCNKQRTAIGNKSPIVSNKCSCGGSMVDRHNSTTGEKFKGCSNYPNCKNTLKL